MSKTVSLPNSVTTGSLADSALSSGSDNPAEKVVEAIEVYATAYPTDWIQYPVSKTDQLHALSVADMVKNQQGSIFEPDLAQYDLPDGVDNSSIQPHSLNELEWADPAERYEAEQRLNSEFASSVKAVRRSSDVSDTTSDTKASGLASDGDVEIKKADS